MNAPSNVSVVTIFVRHSAACKYKGDEFCGRCNCRKHLRWTAGGVRCRRSAKARTWAEAERQKQYLFEQMSAGNTAATPTVAPAIHSLVEAFVTSKQSQRIGGTTVKRHKRELNRLADFLAENGIFVPNAITAAALHKFRETWKTLYPASSTQREAQQRIRQFLASFTTMDACRSCPGKAPSRWTSHRRCRCMISSTKPFSARSPKHSTTRVSDDGCARSPS